MTGSRSSFRRDRPISMPIRVFPPPVFNLITRSFSFLRSFHAERALAWPSHKSFMCGGFGRRWNMAAGSVGRGCFRSRLSLVKSTKGRLREQFAKHIAFASCRHYTPAGDWLTLRCGGSDALNGEGRILNALRRLCDAQFDSARCRTPRFHAPKAVSALLHQKCCFLT